MRHVWNIEATTALDWHENAKNEQMCLLLPANWWPLFWGPFQATPTLYTCLDQITLNLVYLIIQLPIKTRGPAQIYKRLISLSCSVVLLGKCHLDVGQRGSRSPSRSKFNHIASSGPVLTLISPSLVQECDLPCWSPGTPPPHMTRACHRPAVSTHLLTWRPNPVWLCDLLAEPTPDGAPRHLSARPA